eukprot:2298315-Pleurochrysis_carterae.AAC.6
MERAAKHSAVANQIEEHMRALEQAQLEKERGVDAEPSNAQQGAPRGDLIGSLAATSARSVSSGMSSSLSSSMASIMASSMASSTGGSSSSAAVAQLPSQALEQAARAALARVASTNANELSGSTSRVRSEYGTLQRSAQAPSR